MKIVSWFSCGAASAVATKLALAKYGPGNVDVIRVHIEEEHPDNDRFARDCEGWFGTSIQRATAIEYAGNSGAGSTFCVFHTDRYLVGPSGARCTRVLKKGVREALEHRYTHHVFGYTSEEQDRVDRFIDGNAHIRLLLPLIEEHLTKADCLALVQRAGIRLPQMYLLGYANNNCVGCVKGGAGYWNKIRKDFPQVFERMARTEELLGRTVLRRDGRPQPLRQLDPDAGRFSADQPGECGIFCLAAEDKL